MDQSIKMPEPPTGYRHAKCYANADANCSTKISKEHFISAALLRQLQLNNKAKIAGLAWQEPEKFNLIPVKGLASNILCERHNNALSGLDGGIGAPVKTIHKIDKSSKDRKSSFNGSNIERWMLKCLIGMTASNNINLQLKPECIDLLFGRSDWQAGWGLYFSNVGTGPIYHTDSLLIEIRAHPTVPLILGADFFIQGLPFTLIMGKPGDPKAFGLWRPSSLIFQKPSATQTILLTWDNKSSGVPITLVRTGTYDGHPPNWKDWEKYD